jgi:flavin-dependent dehydrogenase
MAEVIIVGGGPGGSAAAISLALAGCSTLLIERESFPRHRPGETLHPGIEPLFDTLGVGERIRSAGFHRISGIWLEGGGEKRFEPYGGDWRGFQAPRDSLDAILLERAREAGAEVCQSCRADGLCVEQGRARGVVIRGRKVASRFVLDASGSRRWLSRHLGLAVRQDSPALIAHYGYAQGLAPEWDDGNPRFAFDSSPRSMSEWTWTARISDGLYHWTRLQSARLPAKLAGLAAMGRPRAADVTWRLVEASAGPGYFLLGDAAAVLDPASSHGVLRAVMSGIMAAHWITAVRNGKATEGMASAAYSEWMSAFYMHDARRLRELYASGGSRIAA